jgi:hypothetical protein
MYTSGPPQGKACCEAAESALERGPTITDVGAVRGSFPQFHSPPRTRSREAEVVGTTPQPHIHSCVFLGAVYLGREPVSSLFGGQPPIQTY